MQGLVFRCRKNEKGLDGELRGRMENAKSSSSAEFAAALAIPSFEKSVPHREIQWAESRRCLLDAAEDFVRDGKPFYFSISHTDHVSAAVAALVSTDVGGIGIDVENIDREISPKAAEKFVSPAERALPLTDLEIWVIKESCFKASSALIETVSQIEIQSFDRAKDLGTANLTNGSEDFCEFEIKTSGDFVTAVARRRTLKT